MEKKVFKFKLISFYAFMLSLAIFNILVYLSMRPFWYFINRDTKTPVFSRLPFTSLIFIIYAAFLCYTLILLLACLNQKKVFISRPSILNIIAPSILSIILGVFTVYLFTRMEGDQYLVLNYLKSVNPYLFIIILLFLMILINPNTKFGIHPIIYYGMVIVSLIVMVFGIFDFGNVKITSGPNIQIMDSNNLGIVWTTDENSTSFVEYGPDKDKLKGAFASTNGLIDTNTKIHRVTIPYPKDSSIVYRVISRKINRYYQNNVEYGNTVISELKTFSDAGSKSKLVFYTLNDIHENLNIYKTYLKNDNYDFVVLNGDTINSSDNASEIVGKMLKPMSVAAGGEKPFYFVRGNHETRGGAARDLPGYLALPNNHYYYTFSIGSLFGVVLDSSEDKADDHEEYAGLAVFESYKQEETDWLQAVYQSNIYKNSKYKVAFVHIPPNEYTKDEHPSYLKAQMQNWSKLLNKMKIDVVFSGHTHTPAIIKPDNTEFPEFTYPIIIGGGPTDSQSEYVAVKTEVTSNSMKIYFVGFDGSTKLVYEKN
jgi:acid phosphatase type 7